MALKYHVLSKELQEQITEDRAKNWENPYKCKDTDALRRDPAHDNANLWRPAFVRDIEKILHLPVYNRYADKTQVFSLYHNLARLTTAENPDIFRVVQYIMLCKAGEIGGN